MKKALIALSVAMIATGSMASDVWRVYVGQSNYVTGVSRHQSLSDPTPLAANEVKIGGTDANPVRFPAGYSFPATNSIYWKWDGAVDIVEMSAAEKAGVDIAQEEADDSNKDAQTTSTLNTAYNKALAKTLADLANTQATNVTAIFKAHYRAELDN